MDAALPAGGLRLGALHEVAGGGPSAVHGAAAVLFVAGVLARLPGPVLWCLRQRTSSLRRWRASPSPRAGDLCRGRRREGCAGFVGGRPAPRRAGRSRRRVGHDRVATPAAGRGGGGCDRFRRAALAESGGCGGLRPAHRLGQPMARLSPPRHARGGSGAARPTAVAGGDDAASRGGSSEVGAGGVR